MYPAESESSKRHKLTACFFFVFVFTATPKIKHSKGRSDTISEGGEGKLFFVLHHNNRHPECCQYTCQNNTSVIRTSHKVSVLTD